MSTKSKDTKKRNNSASSQYRTASSGSGKFSIDVTPQYSDQNSANNMHSTATAPYSYPPNMSPMGGFVYFPPYMFPYPNSEYLHPQSYPPHSFPFPPPHVFMMYPPQSGHAGMHPYYPPNPPNYYPNHVNTYTEDQFPHDMRHEEMHTYPHISAKRSSVPQPPRPRAHDGPQHILRTSNPRAPIAFPTHTYSPSKYSPPSIQQSTSSHPVPINDNECTESRMQQDECDSNSNSDTSNGQQQPVATEDRLSPPPSLSCSPAPSPSLSDHSAPSSPFPPRREVVTNCKGANSPRKESSASSKPSKPSKPLGSANNPSSPNTKRKAVKVEEKRSIGRKQQPPQSPQLSQSKLLPLSTAAASPDPASISLPVEKERRREDVATVVTTIGGESENSETDPIKVNMLSCLRKYNMDFLLPQVIHDKILLCLYAALKAFPMAVNHRQLIGLSVALKELNVLSGVDIVSKTKARGLLAILKQSNLVIKCGQYGEAVQLYLSETIQTFAQFRSEHDNYLMDFFHRHQIVEIFTTSLREEVFWCPNQRFGSKEREETTCHRRSMIVEEMLSMLIDIAKCIYDIYPHIGAIQEEEPHAEVIERLLGERWSARKKDEYWRRLHVLDEALNKTYSVSTAE